MAVTNISGTVAARSTISHVRHVNFGSEPAAFPIKVVKPLGDKEQPAAADGDETETPKTWYKKSFVDFCNATALHGYSYIVQKDASPYERYEMIDTILFDRIIIYCLILNGRLICFG